MQVPEEEELQRDVSQEEDPVPAEAAQPHPPRQDAERTEGRARLADQRLPAGFEPRRVGRAVRDLGDEVAVLIDLVLPRGDAAEDLVHAARGGDRHEEVEREEGQHGDAAELRVDPAAEERSGGRGGGTGLESREHPPVRTGGQPRRALGPGHERRRIDRAVREPRSAS